MHFPFANILRLFSCYSFFFFLCFLLFTYFWHLQCHGKPQPQNQSDICLQWNDPFCWHKVVALYCSYTVMKTRSSGLTRCVFMHIREKKPFFSFTIKGEHYEANKQSRKLNAHTSMWIDCFFAPVRLSACSCAHVGYVGDLGVQFHSADRRACIWEVRGGQTPADSSMITQPSCTKKTQGLQKRVMTSRATRSLISVCWAKTFQLKCMTVWTRAQRLRSLTS